MMSCSWALRMNGSSWTPSYLFKVNVWLVATGTLSFGSLSASLRCFGADLEKTLMSIYPH